MILSDIKKVKIREQTINDAVTGLRLVFRVTPSGEGRLHLMGDCLLLGNRDFQFDKDGQLVGTGTGVNAIEGQ